MSIEDVRQIDSKEAGKKSGSGIDGDRSENRQVFSESEKGGAGACLLSECFGPSAQNATKRLDQFHGQLDAKLCKLFDGDRPLEICAKPAAVPAEQKWLVVMNMAVDFGGECTIEKRTKKLQELAAQTEGKAVTIVVQSTVKDEEGDKYHLERFVLKDGKVEKLKSPGESKGYGEDVESLVKYATGTYRCKNMGLILDSHGNGNEGLIGDNGNISMPDLKTRVQNGLKGSGHEKLDFLQFDACLMAQSGVLEATQSLADHIVASAEPEGVTADTAAADNKNLAQLLKDPTMTPDQLSEWCVAQARDVQGFDTLAHFDMAKYATFKKSLDDFGEKLVKLWSDPGEQAVLSKIISETFEYGGGGGVLGEIFQAVTGKDRPTAKPDAGSENKPEAVPGKPTLNELLDFLREKPLFSIMPFAELPAFKRSLERPKRDLKDFIEKVVAAIDEGKLKDDDCSLRDAAQKALNEGATLTKSFFGRGNHKGLGGLSVFLPEAGNGTILSAPGAWRQFQELVRAEAKAKPAEAEEKKHK
jgi:hypothetical protein